MAEEEKKGDTFVIQGRQVDFNAFLLGLASTALIHLGAAPHPETGKTRADLVLARESLDLLSLLKEKTKGNLTPEEEKLFESLLADLRLRYVEATRH